MLPLSFVEWQHAIQNHTLRQQYAIFFFFLFFFFSKTGYRRVLAAAVLHVFEREVPD